MTRRIIAYYRVSTFKQGRSGLGLEAQREALARFGDTEGFEIVREFVKSRQAKALTPSTVAHSSPLRSQISKCLGAGREFGQRAMEYVPSQSATECVVQPPNKQQRTVPRLSQPPVQQKHGRWLRLERLPAHRCQSGKRANASCAPRSAARC